MPNLSCCPPPDSAVVEGTNAIGVEEVFFLGDAVFKTKHSFLRVKRSSKRVEKRGVRIALAKVRF